MSPLLLTRRPASEARPFRATRSFAALAALAALALLAIPTSASAVEHPFIENLGAASAAEPSFTEAQGLAVDQSTGDLLVLDRNQQTLSRWHSDGSPSEFSALGSNVIDEVKVSQASAGNPGELQVAVDSSCALHEPPLTALTTPTCEEFDPADGDIYVAELAAKRIGIYGEDGSTLGQLTGYDDGSEKLFTFPLGVGVDSSGSVYVGDLAFGGSFSGVHKYEPTANPPVNTDSINNFPFTETGTLAAGAGPLDGFIFPVHFNGAVAKLDGASGAQKYVVDPGPISTVTIDPATGTLFGAVRSSSEVKEFDVSGETEALPGIPITSAGGEVAGIAVDGSSGRIYVSRKGNPHIEVWGPAVQLPSATTEEASIDGDTITLHGTVSANQGPPAGCVFQYADVKTDGFKDATSVPCDPAGPFTGTATETVSAQLTDLPEAWYRFRLLASNQDGSTAGETFFFSTIAEPSLPDSRAYEMVSPPSKFGEVIAPEPSVFLGSSCGDCLPGEQTPVMPMQSAPDGDSVLYYGQPFTTGLAADPNEYVADRIGGGWETQSLSAPTTTGVFQAFSDDLSRSVLAQQNPPLSPQAPSRGGRGFENFYLLQSGTPTPLITNEPPDRDPKTFRVQFSGANAGSAVVPPFSHVAFEADDALTEAVPGIAPAAPEVGAGACTLGEAECNLYEWTDGKLRLVNVLPDESAAGNSVIGAGRLLMGGGPPIFEANAIDHAISDDGSRIFWSSEETGQVYVRVNGEETLEIPGPGSCKETVPTAARACFLTASPDGSSVLLSDGTLYELNLAGTAYEESADLAEGEGGFQGILGAGEDLSRIYFVDTAVLSAGGNANGEEPEGGEFNLYSWDEGEISFIGRLASDDRAFGTRSSYGTWTASPSQRTAQVSRDGSWLAFMSLVPLTGYDNSLRGGGNCGTGTPACREVFVYSADSGELSCASCNPSGQQPIGSSNLSLIRPNAPFRQPANLSPTGEGRVFFGSLDSLVSRDLNGRIQDIYEWEPDGVGSCNLPDGCVHLISSGNSAYDSMFMDSSASGDDAFFITRDRLLPTDKDEMLDLYDARVGGGFTEAEESPCLAEACKGPFSEQPPRPLLATPGHFGPGNPPPKKPCRKGFVRRKGRCVKKPKKHEHGDKRDRRTTASRLDSDRRGSRR
jgi:hypothetical protein